MSKLTVCKATLSTGKIVYLRAMRISDTEQAAQMVAARSNGDKNVLQVLMQKALAQLLIVKVGDKTLTGMEKEDMDGLFSMGEYSQVLQVIGKMSGGDDVGKEPKLETTVTEA